MSKRFGVKSFEEVKPHYFCHNGGEIRVRSNVRSKELPSKGEEVRKIWIYDEEVLTVSEFVEYLNSNCEEKFSSLEKRIATLEGIIGGVKDEV